MCERRMVLFGDGRWWCVVVVVARNYVVSVVVYVGAVGSLSGSGEIF